jgi:hypothetical protein
VRESTVLGAYTSPLDALEAVCEAVDVADAELVTLMIGAEVVADEREAAIARVQALVAGELEVIDAGCRPSRFWVGAE